MIVPLYKGYGERKECKNYRGISLLYVVGKIYAGILVFIIRRVTGGLVDDEQRGFREGKGCEDQIRGKEKKFSIYVGVYRFGKGVR